MENLTKKSRRITPLTTIMTPVPLFIARFRYSESPITKAKFVKQLCKAFTVEEYAEAVKHDAPVLVLKANDPSWYSNIMDAALAKAS